MARTARALKVVLTEEEAVQLRASVLIRLHVERVNGGGGPQDEMLSALLVKLGYTAHLAPPRHLPRVAPPEGEGKE